MAVLENLEPKAVFDFFEKICSIPHGSGNTKQLSDWILSFAKDKKLECYQDDSNNVIIIKEATPGYENVEPVILQGHIDMVCEIAPDCTKDMSLEGLDLIVDGDILRADGTTLGGDNGIAVAMILAILNDDGLSHPRIEAIFTVDEEIGLLGASAIELPMIKGKTMINLDSEDEGIFTVSCAGGCVTECTMPVIREEFSGESLSVTISGLKGGHSGIMIHEGRGNSNILMGRLLHEIAQHTDMRIISINGGLKDNAIPVETTVNLVVKCVNDVNIVCKTVEEALKNEYGTVDPDVSVRVSDCSYAVPFNKECTDKVICLLNCSPNGVTEMSADIEGLVQTSLNCGVVKTENNCFLVDFSIRSSITSQKHALSAKIANLAAILGCSAKTFGDYPGWEYRKESTIRPMLINVFKEQFGRDPEIAAIHAGLECGLFADKIPELDCVSIGPDLKEIHTFRERVSISSVNRLWRLLTETLKRMK